MSEVTEAVSAEFPKMLYQGGHAYEGGRPVHHSKTRVVNTPEEEAEARDEGYSEANGPAADDGEPGADTLDGGSGADTVSGGEGAPVDADGDGHDDATGEFVEGPANTGRRGKKQAAE